MNIYKTFEKQKKNKSIMWITTLTHPSKNSFLSIAMIMISTRIFEVSVVALYSFAIVDRQGV